MGHFRRHANALAERGMRVNGFAEVYRVGAHLNGQCDITNHGARMRADHAAAEDFPVAVGSGESSNISLVTPSSRPLAMARPEAPLIHSRG